MTDWLADLERKHRASGCRDPDCWCHEVPSPDPTLGRWIWKETCQHCGTSFGGFERDYTDPIKDHYDYCPNNPDNHDMCETGS